ncbi:hypothetical protein BHE97_09705 [Aeromicrobium sp. PE09-221]|uniref:hypothetical protein n=1 Tax=Aeromicrobium sp. PE09-221 TaxID=1898043 RepID=UPI000B3ED38C|nr:hypothetical protein [Aeromicrobium sp. PE09-221]OUZ09726.1 hypothetical protein BHE97_09705 [Aeromicrobium sp. PE09-221]
MRRRWAAGIAVAAAIGALSACADDTDAYCDELEKVSGPFAELSAGDFSQIDQVMDDMTALEEKAPEEVQDEWQTFGSTIRELQAAVEEEGLTIAEMIELAQEPELSEEDQARLAAVDESLADLDLPSVGDASGEISQHAERTCDLSLNGTDDDQQ